ncbi:MAG TPA: plastocyanin/azurin family copper-binding protein [Gaiellaceae bacterium]|nr:plastocyanin/azurin family copper-binding protein [Gaiellaceae bacterium]
MTRLFLLLFTVLALAVGVAACGGDDDDSGDEAAAEETTTHEESTDGGTHLTLTADPGGALSFDQTELTAAAGEITIELVNESGVPHNVEIEGEDAVTETITEGSTELTVTLEPGTYTYFCNIPGHREGGMEGTLTVE